MNNQTLERINKELELELEQYLYNCKRIDTSNNMYSMIEIMKLEMDVIGNFLNNIFIREKIEIKKLLQNEAFHNALIELLSKHGLRVMKTKYNFK